MITKANDTVLDLGSKITPDGKFQKLSVAGAPVNEDDVVNLGYAEHNFVSTIGDSTLTASSLRFVDDFPLTMSMVLNANKGDMDAGPTIQVHGSAFFNAEETMYIGSSKGHIHFVSGSTIAGEAAEAFCIHHDMLESNIGALVLRSPDVPGSPDPSPYILLEPVAPGQDQSPGGSKAPAIVMSNPDNPVQALPYQFTKISNRDGTILQIEGDTNFGDGTPVAEGTPVFAIKQLGSVHFDFFMKVLKRVAEPVDDDDVATKRYVDDFGGTVFASSSFGPTGYVVFKGGLILQWGAAPEAPGGVATVTLPITWSTGFMVGFCAAEVGGGDTKVGSITSTTPSQVTVKYNGSGTPVTPVAGSWIALGY